MSMTLLDFNDTFNKFGSVDEESLESFERGADIKNYSEVKESVDEYIKRVSNAVKYLDAKCNEVAKEDCKYILIATGLTNRKGQSITIAFRKISEGFRYYYTAHEDKIIKAIQTFNRQNNCEEECTKETVQTGNKNQRQEIKTVNKVADKTADKEYKSVKIADEIYNQLLIKSGWDRHGDSRIVKSYIDTIKCKIEAELLKGERNYFVMSKDGSKIMCNTGLTSNLGNNFILCYRLDKSDKLTESSIIVSKTDAVKEGFEASDFCSIKPFKFYKSILDTVFTSTIDNFDLYNKGRIYHMIEDRRDRLPEYARELPNELLYSRIQYSIETSLKIAEHDLKWIMPIYYISNDEMCYLFPLFINNSFSSGEAEAAIVVGKGEMFLEAKTILKLDDAFRDAMCVSRVGNNWL